MSQLPAGRELDTLVAERVMGCVPCDKWTPVRCPEAGWLKNCQCGACYPAGDPAYYSTNIAAAFQAVDKLLDGTRAFILECYNLEAKPWHAIFRSDLGGKPPLYKRLDTAWADTISLAICHAALKAVEERRSCES